MTISNDLPLEENPIWIQDHVSLVSVGIDIGSREPRSFSRASICAGWAKTCPVAFCRLARAIYESPVTLTPYQSEERIDERALAALSMTPITAPASCRRTSIPGRDPDRRSAAARETPSHRGILAEKGGEFVCAAAGHHMEANAGAYGSGAARVSSDENKRILNIDIGGGTTQAEPHRSRAVVRTAAVHVGGRCTLSTRREISSGWIPPANAWPSR